MNQARPAVSQGAKRPHLATRLPLLATALLASASLLLCLASSASALNYAMNFRNYDANDLEITQRSGATVFRSELDFTCTGGGSNWGQFDPIVEAGWKRGITILPVLVRSYPACENAQHKRFLNSGDGNWGNWGSWARQAVERYGINGSFWNGKANPTPITAWEVGNEPNLAANNPGGEVVQPQAYGEFLSYTANALQAGSVAKTAHGTEVISAGLYMPGGYNYRMFWEKMGATGSYTAVGIHPYSFKEGATGAANEITMARLVLNNYIPGGNTKALWITEIGWNVAGTGGLPPGTAPVDESQQASLLHESFDWVQANAGGLNIALLTWYKIQDQSTSGNNWDEHTGLRRYDGTYRPAWFAYQEETGAPKWPVAPPPPVIYGEDDDFSGPHVVAKNDGTIDVLWRTPSGGLERYGWSAANGSSSGTIPGELASVPHVVEQSNGTVDAYWRTPSNQLGHAWRGAGGSPWSSQSIQVELGSDPHPIVQDNGTEDVFWRTPTGELGHFWYVPGVGSYTEVIQKAEVASDPIPVLRNGGAYDVFWRTPSGNLGHYWYVPGGSGALATTPAELASDPHVEARSDGAYDVFWRTPSGNLGHFWYAPGGSGATATIPADLASDPHFINQHSGVVDVFWRTPSGKLGHYWYVPGPGSSSEVRTATVAGALAATPTTEAPTAVGSSGATLNAKVNPKGSTTTYQFEYGKTTSYGSKAPATPGFVGSGTAALPASGTISGLTPNTSYHYRVVAINEGGTTYGSDKAFTTSK